MIIGYKKLLKKMAEAFSTKEDIIELDKRMETIAAALVEMNGKLEDVKKRVSKI